MSNDDKKRDSKPTASALNPDAAPYIPIAPTVPVAPKNKKLRYPEAIYDGCLETLHPKIRRRVEALNELRIQRGDLVTEFLAERAALEAKYEKLYQQLYTKRFEIVSGITEAASNVNDTTKYHDENNIEAGVPDFWLNVMKTHRELAEEISERDEAALKHLQDVKWSSIDDPKGFKLEFLFATNPFIKNSVLTKMYHTLDPGRPKTYRVDDKEPKPSIKKALGTEIEWYPGMSLTEKSLKRKSDMRYSYLDLIMDGKSFFKFFSPPQPQVPNDDDDDSHGDQLEEDYEFGLIFRDKIIPHALSWFTEEAIQSDTTEYHWEGDTDEDYDFEEEDDEEEEFDYAAECMARGKIELFNFKRHAGCCYVRGCGQRRDGQQDGYQPPGSGQHPW